MADPALDAAVIEAEADLTAAEGALGIAEVACHGLEQTTTHRYSLEYTELFSNYDPVFTLSVDSLTYCSSASFLNSSNIVRYVLPSTNSDDGTFSFTINKATNIRVRAIGGGGGGSATSGGGGGAGTYVDKEFIFPAGTYNCTIGAGGLGGQQGINNGEAGQKGNSTIISSDDDVNVLTIFGGGGGRNSTGNYGSSAGGDVYQHSANNSAAVGPCLSKTGFFDVPMTQYVGSGVANVYANRGGNATTSSGWSIGFAGAGGGGAAHTGFDNWDNATKPGVGGFGVNVEVNSAYTFYAGGGGGGGNYYATHASGGSYGAGNGGNNAFVGGDASVGSGAGGGGGGFNTYSTGGSGASGFILLEFIQ